MNEYKCYGRRCGTCYDCELSGISSNLKPTTEEAIEIMIALNITGTKTMTTPKKKRFKPLKGNITSGIIYIGDPSYMQGDLSQPGSEEIEKLENPFYNWGRFIQGLNYQDVSLPFPGAIEDNSTGRGIVLQTNKQGTYEVKKKFDKSGKLVQIVVNFRE